MKSAVIQKCNMVLKAFCSFMDACSFRSADCVRNSVAFRRPCVRLAVALYECGCCKCN